ncbi:MAG: HEAT repeat domain-containing protein [Methanolobus sp.]|nr:HEAT repeat domain-containing protein [Methanolobus sp.]
MEKIWLISMTKWNLNNKLKSIFIILFTLSLCIGCIEESTVESQIQDLNDENVSVKSEAEEELVEIGEPAIDPLIEVLSGKNEVTQTRVVAAKILGKIGDKRAVEPLIQTLDEQQYWETRNASAVALGDIGDRSAVEPLVSVLQNGYANEQTIEFGTSSATMITGGDVQLMCSAAEALGKIGDERAVEHLIVVLENEYAYRQAQTTEFGDGGKISMVSEDRIQLACNAAEALGKFGDERAIEPLKQLQNDENRYIKVAATNALEKLEENKLIQK